MARRDDARPDFPQDGRFAAAAVALQRAATVEAAHGGIRVDRTARHPELARMHADVILRAILARKPQEATLLLRSHIEQSKLEVRKISIHRLHLAHAEAKA